MPDTWAAQWAAGWAQEAQRFNHMHAPAGSPAGGQFSSGGSGGAGSKSGSGKNGAGKMAHPVSGRPAAGHGNTSARKASLHAQARRDRLKAHQLELQLNVLLKQEHKAQQAAKHAHAAAKHAHAQAKANANAASKKHATAAHHKHKTASKHHASLKTRIAGLRHQIATLLGQAKQLDAQAAKL